MTKRKKLDCRSPTQILTLTRHFLRPSSPENKAPTPPNVELSDTNDSDDVVMTNGKEASNGTTVKVTQEPETSSNEETMDVDQSPPSRLSVTSNPSRFQCLITFGRGLQTMLHVRP